MAICPQLQSHKFNRAGTVLVGLSRDLSVLIKQPIVPISDFSASQPGSDAYRAGGPDWPRGCGTVRRDHRCAPQQDTPHPFRSLPPAAVRFRRRRSGLRHSRRQLCRRDPHQRFTQLRGLGPSQYGALTVRCWPMSRFVERPCVPGITIRLSGLEMSPRTHLVHCVGISCNSLYQRHGFAQRANGEHNTILINSVTPATCCRCPFLHSGKAPDLQVLKPRTLECAEGWIPAHRHQMFLMSASF